MFINSLKNALSLKVEKSKILTLGYKYSIELENNERIEVIDLFKGFKKVFFIKDDSIKCSFELSEEEAKKLGFILADLEETEEKPIFKDKVLMDWFKLKKGFFAVNKKIKDLKIRSKTGATVIAIERDDKIISSITPETEFKEDDKILLVGNLKSIEKAIKLLREGDKK